MGLRTDDSRSGISVVLWICRHFLLDIHCVDLPGTRSLASDLYLFKIPNTMTSLKQKCDQVKMSDQKNELKM